MKRQTSLYLIVIGLFLLLISGGFLTEGLSRAGMDNAVVSQRMAEGFEDFWLPSLSSPGNPDRMNYLPLGYWIESQWYNLFGDDSFMAEKVYSVLTFFIIAALMIWIWRLIGMPKNTGWLPLLCWITIPIVSWSATNNLLESTMTMFILLSVAFLLKSEKARSTMRIRQLRRIAGKQTNANNSQWKAGFAYVGWIILAALAMELAFMVKGFSGLFPIFFPILYWLIVERKRTGASKQSFIYPIISTALILTVWMVTLFVAIINSPEVYHHLYNYLHHQMIGGILHVQTVASRFYIIYVLVLQSIIPLLIIAIISLIRIKNRPFYRFVLFWHNEKKLTAMQVEHSKMGWLFLALGLSGIVPIMLGLKQQEFYVVPTLPFFALVWGFVLYYLLQDWIENINLVAHRVLMAIAVLIFGSGLVLNVASLHKINSNEELLSDMKILLPYLYDGECVSVSDEVMQDAEVAEYFYRYKKVTFDSNPGNVHLISIYSNVKYEYGNLRYSDMQLPTQMYRMFKLIEEPIIIDTAVASAPEDSAAMQTEESLSDRLFHPLDIDY